MENESPKHSHHYRWPAPGQLVVGILFITLGAIFLVAQFVGRGIINDFWPLFLIAGGLVFYAAYFLRHDKPAGYEGMLFPGTYLSVLGILFIAMNIFGWHAMRYMWPTFLFGVPISLGSMYLLGPKDNEIQRKDIMSAINILSIISGILYLFTIGGFKLLPVILIIIGVIIVYKGLTRKRHRKSATEE